MTPSPNPNNPSARRAGHSLGLGARWERLPFVQKNAWLG